MEELLREDSPVDDSPADETKIVELSSSLVVLIVISELTIEGLVVYPIDDNVLKKLSVVETGTAPVTVELPAD